MQVCGSGLLHDVHNSRSGALMQARGVSGRSLSRSFAVAAALAALAAGRGGAQAPGERARLDTLRDSLVGISDSIPLLAREQAIIALARQNREEPMIHLELGLIAFRLGEITGADRHFNDGAGEFEWASELRPNWPFAWYWLGQSELALGESSIIPLENIRQLLGTDHLSRAVRAFTHAAQADPSFGRALVDLGVTALRQRISPRLRVAQGALRLSANTPAAEQPAVLLVRGRVERELGANDSALAAFRAYVSLGGDAALGTIEIARSLCALGQADSGVVAYFAAARMTVSDTARVEFRRDLRWIATPEDLRALDALAPDSLEPWLRRFWGRRDVADARRPGERLIEQFRRYTYAREHFRLVSRHRHYDIAEVYRDTTQNEFDDRGIIYLRHGEPDARARYSDENGVVQPNETWAYRRPSPPGDLVFHFVARGDVQDFKLVESLLDAYDFSVSGTLAGAGGIPVDMFAGLLMSRVNISPMYERLARGGSAGRSSLLAQERHAGQEAVRRGTTSDSYALRFERDLRPRVTSFTVAGPGGLSELHVVFAIAASALEPFAASTGGTAYPLRLRVTVFDSAQRTIGSVDTLRVFHSGAPLASGSFLTEQLVVAVPPGTYQFHFVVEEANAERGGLVASEAVHAPTGDGGFDASDIVLGQEGSGLVWRRPEGEVPLSPLMRFPRDGTVTLYYEIYGLPGNSAVPTQVAVAPRGGRSFLGSLFGRRNGVGLQYVTQTDAPGRTRVSQRIDLAGLRPGRYDIELELRHPGSGVRIVRRQSFEIAGQRAP